MYRDKERYGQDPTVVMRSKTNFMQPLGWREPALVFTCSWSDWFIEEADAWRGDAWDIIKATPWLTYQILTKRPERILANLPKDWGKGYPNVWLGVSVEDQAAAEKRIPLLLGIPAKIHFLSCEPLLGPVFLRHIEADKTADSIIIIDALTGNKREIGRAGYPILPIHNVIDWVIVGGESGNDTGKYRYRECKTEWFDIIIADCEKTGVPVFVKQMGTHLAKLKGYKDRHGGDIKEWPKELQVREFPPETKAPVHVKGESAGYLEDDIKR